MRTVYADNNATTAVAPEVLEAMLPFFREHYGNPSSMHLFAVEPQEGIARARERVAALLGADPSEIVFTSCGTESDNAAIRGALEAQPFKRHIVTTKVEHAAVLGLCKHLQTKGYQVTFLSVDSEGRLDLNELEDSVTEQTAIVSVMYANNETGVLNPIEEIGQIVKRKGIIFHTDAVQAVGKVPINLANSTIDMLSMSGHKIHAPKGVGALFIRRGTRFEPFMVGGHQERGRRGGTENVPYIVGLGRACELAQKDMLAEAERERRMRDRLEREIVARIPDCRINGGKADRLPNTSNVSFEFVEGEAILLLLSQRGIAASSGSACTSGSLEPSHVLRAMGVPFTFAHGSVRISFSRYNREDDVDIIAQALQETIVRLREISPFKRQPGAAMAGRAVQ